MFFTYAAVSSYRLFHWQGQMKRESHSAGGIRNAPARISESVRDWFPAVKREKEIFEMIIVNHML